MVWEINQLFLKSIFADAGIMYMQHMSMQR